MTSRAAGIAAANIAVGKTDGKILTKEWKHWIKPIEKGESTTMADGGVTKKNKDYFIGYARGVISGLGRAQRVFTGDYDGL